MLLSKTVLVCRAQRRIIQMSPFPAALPRGFHWILYVLVYKLIKTVFISLPDVTLAKYIYISITDFLYISLCTYFLEYSVEPWGVLSRFNHVLFWHIEVDANKPPKNRDLGLPHLLFICFTPTPALAIHLFHFPWLDYNCGFWSPSQLPREYLNTLNHNYMWFPMALVVQHLLMLAESPLASYYLWKVNCFA